VRLNSLAIFDQARQKFLELQILTAISPGCPGLKLVDHGKDGLNTFGLPLSMVDFDLSNHTLERIIIGVIARVLTLLFFFLNDYYIAQHVLGNYDALISVPRSELGHVFIGETILVFLKCLAILRGSRERDRFLQGFVVHC
jgi:hypothetical protein